MTGAMYAAIGGLKTHMNNLNVIGNNTANVNTAGYKAQRQIFQETIYTTYRSGSNGGPSRGGITPSQIGFGAQVGSIDLNMSPSTYNPTGQDLDCMIEGDGFFMVGDKDAMINGIADVGRLQLTRVGDFCVDPEGYICDGQGNVVYGFATVQNPYYNPNASDADKQAAEEAGYNTTDKTIISSALVPMRVPAAATEPTEANGGAPAGSTSPLWQTGDPVYDLLGTVDPNNNNGRGNISVEDAIAAGTTGGAGGGNTNNGTVELLPGVGLPTPSGNNQGGTGTQDKLTYPSTLTGPIPNDEGKRVNIKSLSINEMGAITGTCDAGTVVLGYVAIANVTSPSGVTHMGGPYYQALEGAGDITVSGLSGIMTGRYLNNKVSTEAGQGGQGGTDVITPPNADAIGSGKGSSIRNGGLEASNTDIATEFANMIVTQRGYQANTRIITVTDSMLEELVNMKR